MIPQRGPYLLLLLVICARAQTCPPNSEASASASTYQDLTWPATGYEIDVSDNQQHRWILRFSENALILQGYQETRTASISATLTDSSTGNTYHLSAYGTFLPSTLRISPDFAWATFYDVEMEGALWEGSLKFNMSISYADFWTDSPANDLITSKSLSGNADCWYETLYSSGYNYIQTKGFWIAFSFDDRSHIYFNIPPGTPAFVDQRIYTTFSMCH